ncbi:hypothetical protein LZ575_17395 [Antarcticibacterium sp. 1MA-6-2]|uniref:hypothetical protein n=1 Tax=Antarcticibacterium sp. 1MA-6-2 TaxID=2908210 RepID=UPI001F48C4A0|nr:hypothetical protein [Antarcticibacterium sp. 1MA-6-2]UJH90544.1 hypothetical protein LZ575_17395 [Antarcticibacterium sp. 1MA-6-2]
MLQGLIPVLDSVIPQNVYYAKDEKSANFIINISYPKATDSIKIRWNHDTKIANRKGNYNNEIESQHFDLVAPENLRENMIRNSAVIGLVAGLKYRQNLIREYSEEYIDYNSVLLNFFMHKDVHNTQYSKTKEYDNYIIDQIYSPNLRNKAEEYVRQEFNFWQYINWKFGGENTRVLKILIFIFYFLITLFIGYKILFSRKNTKSLIGYFLNSTYLGIVLVIAFIIYLSTPVLSTDYLRENNTNFDYTTIVFILVSTLIISLIGIILYFTEKLTLATIKNLFLKSFIRFSIQIAVCFLILYGVTLFFFLKGNNYAFNQTEDIILLSYSYLYNSLFRQECISLFPRKE